MQLQLAVYVPCASFCESMYEYVICKWVIFVALCVFLSSVCMNTLLLYKTVVLHLSLYIVVYAWLVPPAGCHSQKKDENWVELSNTLSLPNKCIFMRNFQTTASNSGSLKGGHESRLWPNIAAALGPRGPIQLLGPPIHKGYSLHAQWQLGS